MFPASGQHLAAGATSFHCSFLTQSAFLSIFEDSAKALVFLKTRHSVTQRPYLVAMPATVGLRSVDGVCIAKYSLSICLKAAAVCMVCSCAGDGARAGVMGGWWVVGDRRGA